MARPVPFAQNAGNDFGLQFLFHSRDTWGELSLPGYPRIKLQNISQLERFLLKEMWAKDLERLAPHLWMMSKQSSDNISPLHRQKVKGRRIIITENPRLHLVWFEDRIFIKPLPLYLTSYEFWECLLIRDSSPLNTKTRSRLLTSTLGYLRTFFYLIQYESDLRIATEEHLIPDGMNWEKFCAFSENLADIPDDEVSGRYHFGELRLSRLNFYARIFLHTSRYQRVHSQYGAYFAQFYAPILFVFGGFSVALSAMQLEMAVEEEDSPARGTLKNFWGVCRWFSVVTLVFLAIVVAVLLLVFLYKFGREWRYAIKDRLKQRKGMTAVKTGSSTPLSA